MLIAERRDCTDHPAHFAVTHRYKGAITLIGRDAFHSRSHFRCRCFIPQFAHQLGERRRVVHLRGANRKIERAFVRQVGTRSEGGEIKPLQLRGA